MKTPRAQQRISAARVIQARVRGRIVREALGQAVRVWRFGHIVACDLKAMGGMSAPAHGGTTNGSQRSEGAQGSGAQVGGKESHGPYSSSPTPPEPTASLSHTLLCVHQHERLELLTATGRGRLLVTAREGLEGNIAVREGCVYDSSLQAVLSTGSPRARIPPHATAPPARPPLWTAPGGYVYSFTLEPLPGAISAYLSLRFRREACYAEGELLSEPLSGPQPPPARTSPAREATRANLYQSTLFATGGIRGHQSTSVTQERHATSSERHASPAHAAFRSLHARRQVTISDMVDERPQASPPHNKRPEPGEQWGERARMAHPLPDLLLPSPPPHTAVLLSAAPLPPYGTSVQPYSARQPGTFVYGALQHQQPPHPSLQSYVLHTGEAGWSRPLPQPWVDGHYVGQQQQWGSTNAAFPGQDKGGAEPP